MVCSVIVESYALFLVQAVAQNRRDFSYYGLLVRILECLHSSLVVKFRYMKAVN